ncbi:MAG: DUF1700 domain-containing protein [Pseudomonadota bacterium]
MNKTEYMNTLRQELNGLPAEVVEDTMWAYEGRFVDGMVAGRDELEIAASLPAPHIVAAQKRASMRYQELKEKVTPSNFASLLVALLGVMMLNFFMIIPAIIGSILLFAAYLSSMVMYVVGIVITATVLAGVPQVNLNIPTHHFQHINQDFDDDMNEEFSVHHGNVRVDISPSGITVDKDEAGDVSKSAPASNSAASSTAASNAAASNTAVVKTGDDKSAVDKAAVDRSVVHVSIGHHLKTIHIFQGLGFLLGGIALFMLCLFTTKYTFVGFKKYLLWNVSLLRQSTAA